MATSPHPTPPPATPDPDQPAPRPGRGRRLLGGTDALTRNAGSLALTTVVNGALGWGYWALATRSLTPEAVGTAATLVAALNVAGLVANGGLGAALVHLLPRRRSGTAWSATVTAAAALAATGGAAAGAVAALLLRASGAELTIGSWSSVLGLLTVGGAAWTAGLVVDFAAVAERRGHLVLLRFATMGAVKLALLAAIVQRTSGSEVLFATWVIGVVASTAVQLLVLLGRMDRGWRPTMRGFGGQVRILARPASGNYLITLFGQLPAFALPLVVTLRASTEETAWFAVAWMVVTLLAAVSPAVASSLFAEGSHGRPLDESLRLAGRITAAVLVPGAMLLVLLRSPLLSLFGPTYAAGGAAALALLAIGTLPDAVANLGVALCRVRQRYRRAVLLNATLASISLVGAWLLVPGHGGAGAAAAWLAAQSVGAVVALTWRAGLVRDAHPGSEPAAADPGPVEAVA